MTQLLLRHIARKCVIILRQISSKKINRVRLNLDVWTGSNSGYIFHIFIDGSHMLEFYLPMKIKYIHNEKT